MAEQPEQVGVIHHVAAEVVGEEMEAEIAVERQQRRGDGQRRHGENHQDAGAQRRPGEERHAHEMHARRPLLVDGDGEVDAGHHRPERGQRDGPDPIVGADPRTVRHLRIGRIAAPAPGRKLADHQGNHDDCGARRRQAQTDRVHHREGNVARPDLQRHHVVDDAGEKRHRHEEDHDRAVGRKQLAEMVPGQKSAVEAKGLLGAHEAGLDDRARQHDEGQHDIHDADALVIDAGQPFRPENLPLAVPGDEGEGDDAADDDHRCRAGRDDVIDDVVESRVRQRVPERQLVGAEPSKKVIVERHAFHSDWGEAAGLPMKEVVAGFPPWKDWTTSSSRPGDTSLK